MHKYSIRFYRFHIENRDRSFLLPACVTRRHLGRETAAPAAWAPAPLLVLHPRRCATPFYREKKEKEIKKGSERRAVALLCPGSVSSDRASGSCAGAGVRTRVGAWNGALEAVACSV